MDRMGKEGRWMNFNGWLVLLSICMGHDGHDLRLMESIGDV